MKNFMLWLQENQIKSDDLQNELILISHHVDDIEDLIRQGDLKNAVAELDDIRECVRKISDNLNRSQQIGIDRTTE